MGYKILLADDSITIQKVVELVLTPEDFQIKSFNDGEQALSEIGPFRPHIILADIDMPKLNGYQLCEKVKDNPNTSHIPVILLAGAFEPFDEDYAKKAGADDFIIKPFESQELISKVKALVKDMPMEEPAEDDPFAALDSMPVMTEDETTDEQVSGSPSEDISFSPDDFAALQESTLESVDTIEMGQEAASTPSFEETLSGEIADSSVSDSVQTFSAPSFATVSREEILDIYKQAIEGKVEEIFNSEFMESVMNMLIERVAEVIKTSAPLIIQDAADRMLEGIAQDVREQTVAMLNDVVPGTAKSLIEKEINKITADL